MESRLDKMLSYGDPYVDALWSPIHEWPTTLRRIVVMTMPISLPLIWIVRILVPFMLYLPFMLTFLALLAVGVCIAIPVTTFLAIRSFGHAILRLWNGQKFWQQY
jgi:hypothetical protein